MPDPDQTTTLVMLSGGVDSTYLLYKLLHQSDDNLIAHHINLINREGRTDAEHHACLNIVHHLRTHQRDFLYTESLIDRNRLYTSLDILTVAFEAGIVAQSYLKEYGYPINRWSTGLCLEESHDPLEKVKMQYMINAIAAGSFPSHPPDYFQLKVIPKKKQINHMGQPLTSLCWTCRRPIRGKPRGQRIQWLECGQCHTCQLMHRIRRTEPD